MRNIKLITFLSISAAFIGTFFSLSSARGLQSDSSPFIVEEGVLIVKSKRETDDRSFRDEIEALLGARYPNFRISKIEKPYEEFHKRNVSKIGELGLNRIKKIYYSEGEFPETVARSLARLDLFEYAAPRYIPQFCAAPNDSLYPEQYYLDLIGYEALRDFTLAAEGSIIAIVDSEVDWEHEDLAANIRINPGEIPDNGIDDDQNGKIDDVRGWDFAGDPSYGEFKEGIYYEDNDTKIYKKETIHNHGTLVASCAAAVTDNLVGLASPGERCRIIPVKISGDRGYGFRAFEGILYAAESGADVINCSFLLIDTPELNDIVRAANAFGSLIVAASGNNGEIREFDLDLSNGSKILIVGSGGAEDEVSEFSNYGVTTDVFAPGESIACAFPYDSYGSASGSSLSTAICSGVAAAIKSIRPEFSPEQIERQIRATSANVFNSDEKGRFVNYGRIDAANAALVNQNFSTGEVSPGIACVDFRLAGESKTLDSFEETELILTLKNFLAPANGVEVKIENSDGLIKINDGLVTLDAIGTGETLEATFRVAIATGTDWRRRQSSLLVEIRSGDYVDYDLLRFNIHPPPAKVFEPKFTVVADSIYKDALVLSADAANIQTLWISGKDSSGAFYGKYSARGADEFTSVRGDSLTSADVVFGLDYNQAFVAAGKKEGSPALLNVIRDKIENVDLGEPIGEVLKIHFKNEKTGFVFARDFFTGDETFFLTYDGGKSWSKTENFPELTENDSPVARSLAISRDKIIVGTRQGYILRSLDYGKTWTKTRLDRRRSFELFAYSPNGDLLAVYDNWEDLETHRLNFAVSSDSGETWISHEKGDLYEFLGAPAHAMFRSPYTIVIFGESGDATISDDLGNNFYPIVRKAPEGFFEGSATLFSEARDGLKTRVWSVSYGVGYFDFDDIFDRPENELVEPVYFRIYPNPASGVVRVQFYLAKEAEVEVVVYNSLGMEFYREPTRKVDAGVYETVRISTDLLPIGTYFCKLSIDGRPHVGSFITIK